MTATGLTVALCVSFLATNFLRFHLVGNVFTGGQHLSNLIKGHNETLMIIGDVDLFVPIAMGIISQIHDLPSVKAFEIGNRVPGTGCHISGASAC